MALTPKPPADETEHAEQCEHEAAERMKRLLERVSEDTDRLKRLQHEPRLEPGVAEG